MSMHLEFEPHCWYKGFAILDNRNLSYELENGLSPYKWHAYTDDGMTYSIVELESQSLADLKKLISDYRKRESEKLQRLYA